MRPKVKITQAALVDAIVAERHAQLAKELAVLQRVEAREQRRLQKALDRVLVQNQILVVACSAYRLKPIITVGSCGGHLEITAGNRWDAVPSLEASIPMPAAVRRRIERHTVAAKAVREHDRRMHQIGKERAQILQALQLKEVRKVVGSKRFAADVRTLFDRLPS